MTTHSSAQLRTETPHATNSITNKPFSNAVKRRAQSLIKDRSIDRCVRAFIQHTLENEDPYLTKLVRRVDRGKSILTMSPLSKRKSTLKKEETRSTAEIICLAGDQLSFAGSPPPGHKNLTVQIQTFQ